MTRVKLATPRRRPKRVAKRLKKRRGAKTFAGGEELRRRWVALAARGSQHMLLACIAGARFDLVSPTVHTVVGIDLLAGKQHVADRLERFEARGYANPAGTVAAMERARDRRRRELANGRGVAESSE